MCENRPTKRNSKNDPAVSNLISRSWRLKSRTFNWPNWKVGGWNGINCRAWSFTQFRHNYVLQRKMYDVDMYDLKQGEKPRWLWAGNRNYYQWKILERRWILRVTLRHRGKSSLQVVNLVDTLPLMKSLDFPKTRNFSWLTISLWYTCQDEQYIHVPSR